MPASLDAPRAAHPGFLDDRALQLLLFGGKGGVGKTSCAAAAALRLASERVAESFLLVSTDPAHSLADSLAGLQLPAKLTVRELDAQECLAAFRARHAARLQEIAAAGTFLDDEDIQGFLQLSLPGLDELMAFLEIAGWVERRCFACIVVDTAPSGHTLRLLDMPAFLENWLSMLDALLAKRRYLRRVFGRSGGADPLDGFLRQWWDSVRRMKTLLSDPRRCQFVPVAIAEPLSVQETITLLRELERWHIAVPNLVVNQLHPSNDCPTCSDAWTREQEQIRRLCRPEMPALWAADLMANELCGAELPGFWEHVVPIQEAHLAGAVAQRAYLRRVESPAASLSSQVRLVLFAGKGGVGKTTLACATAVRLARDFPHKRILLFSTDPAHSLSACMELEVGPRPVAVLENLSAVEIDAAAEFEALKEQYAGDVEAFLESIAEGFDLTFDRMVLERILDLAPPGLDEVMALAHILELVAHDRFDLFVLDSAATGHFIRLIELPALVDQWLKTFFRVLLKYERVLQLPGFSEQLVTLSRNLKQFRKLLSDPSQAMLEVVSIPTRMAREETRDLLAACDRLGLRVPSLFLNLLTPPGGCELCSRLRRRELQEVQNFRKSCPHQRRTLVYRQGQVVGLPRLEQLARDLYQTTSQELFSYGSAGSSQGYRAADRPVGDRQTGAGFIV